MAIDPITYAQTRNYVDGAVTNLGPYISRGIISTRQIYQWVKQTGVKWKDAEKLIQELAWRDYWQIQWRKKDHLIFFDLKTPQNPVSNYQIPKDLLEGDTGIYQIDKAIKRLYETGQMHNHMRMYIASIITNIAHSHWLMPANWMYAHLLDGDLASNHLSWQWVAGTNSKKKYFANQDNINRYFYDKQKNTFLDFSYDELPNLPIPKSLTNLSNFQLKVDLGSYAETTILQNKKTFVYNYYNLDHFWETHEDAQRILLLEPSVFEQFPIAPHCLDFAVKLARHIPGIICVVQEFESLLESIDVENLNYKEHPLNKSYRGIEHPRDWLSDLNDDYSSFFAFWKKCKKQLEW
ncbi:FAD-binding domain-containing protein [Crocinitomix algicola]|uniref:FAD-binding domain-containing protein n=1 Tax=Crocinitomix algicola TaxID=1740263 RepID=UPI000AFD83EA|nr:FAD-binding domain-containing protein [Crocinitomix algicola]